MSKKPISFGKISFAINTLGQNNVEKDSNSGFGTFGRTPIMEQKDIEDISEDLESQNLHQVMGIKNFGKKAKSYNIDEMVEQARLTAQENKKKVEAENANKEKDMQGTKLLGPVNVSTSNDDQDEEDDEPIGPPIPANLLPTLHTKEYKNNETKNSDNSDEKNQQSEDSYDDLSGSDDEELSIEKRIPNTHEVMYSYIVGKGEAIFTCIIYVCFLIFY